MKIRYLIAAVLAFGGLATIFCGNFPASSKGGPQVDPKSVIEDMPTIQKFLKEPVPEADLIRIARAGVNAPSAMNRQPWHISIVNDPATIDALGKAAKEGMKFSPRRPDGKMPAPPPGNMGKGMAGGVKSGLGDSPAVIIISCIEGSEFDAGLACEAMNDMANLLGYGTKIVSSVTLLFNGEKKAGYYKQFNIPEGQTIVAAILLGKVDKDGYDAVSSASARIDFDQVVTFVK